jgi:hypothetical protein
MPGKETSTSMALRVPSVATSTVLIFVAQTETIISSPAQNSSSNVILINDGDSLSTTFGSSDRRTFMLYALSALTPVTRSAHVSAFYDPKYQLVVHILAGTNDIRAASSASRPRTRKPTAIPTSIRKPKIIGVTSTRSVCVPTTTKANAAPKPCSLIIGASIACASKPQGSSTPTCRVCTQR